MMKIRIALKEDFDVIKSIAEITWPVAYGHILSKTQLDFMMDMMYSKESLTHQHDELKHVFLLALDVSGKVLGFASYSKKIDVNYVSETFHLHKLYVLPDRQQSGIGSYLLNAVENRIRETTGSYILELNVNRNNKAKDFYEKKGFSIAREEDIDIGNGFFMNDYVMAKEVLHVQ